MTPVIIEGEFTEEPKYALLVTQEVADSLTREQIEDILACKPGGIMRMILVEWIKLNDA